MSKKRALLFTAIALVLGLVVGGYATSRWYQRYICRLSANTVALQLAQDTYVLQHFRTGDTNMAIDFLEIDLDGQVAAEKTLLEEIPKSQQNRGDIQYLESAEAYRQAHPPKQSASLPNTALEPTATAPSVFG